MFIEHDLQLNLALRSCTQDMVFTLNLDSIEYKPAALAAGADPSQSNSTNRQNPPFQQNRRNSWTTSAIVMPFEILNLLIFPNIVYFMKGSTISNH